MAGLFFIRLFLNKKKEYKIYFFITILSGLLVLIIFSIYAFLLNNGYYQSDHENGLYDTMFSQGLERILKMFTTKSGLSNSSVPLLLSIIPYILSIKLKVNKFYYSNLDFLIPLSMLFFTTGGGMEQTGRYVMYTMPLWLPILSQQILILIKKNK